LASRETPAGLSLKAGRGRHVLDFEKDHREGTFLCNQPVPVSNYGESELRKFLLEGDNTQGPGVGSIEGEGAVL